MIILILFAELIGVIIFLFAAFFVIKNFIIPRFFIIQPYTEKYWTTLFYGERGSGKTLECARLILNIIKYLKKLYKKFPDLHHAIIMTNLEIAKKFVNENKEWIYTWSDLRELKYCPRKKCWRGKKRHRLHGCYLFADDINTLISAAKWHMIPIWTKKMFTQGRKFGIRIVATCVRYDDIILDFRVTTKVAFRFIKIIGSKDPDETKPPVKRIWGFYKMRKITAELLWKFGDMTEPEIQELENSVHEEEELKGKTPYSDMWRASFRWISRKLCEVYDTNQELQEYIPKFASHHEITCNDPDHPNCGYKKVFHDYE